MYLTESDCIWNLFLEGAAEDMITSALKKRGADDASIKFFTQKENNKLLFKPEHVGQLYDWVAGQVPSTLAQDYRDYLRFFPSKKIGEFKSYIDWTQQLRDKREKAVHQSQHKQLVDIELEGQDKKNIIENNNEILILKGDNEHNCVRYGKGYSFCISRPVVGNMYSAYRSAKASTFYFIFFKQVPREDPKHIMVLDRTERGWEWTFGDNRTRQIEGGWGELIQQFPVLSKYKRKLVNVPKTPEEQAFDAKASEFDWHPTLETFNTFSYAEKATLLKQGRQIPIDVFDALDDHLRGEWVSVGPVLSKEIYDKLTPSEHKRYIKVRKQVISQDGPVTALDHIIINNDGAFKQQLIGDSTKKVQHLLNEIRNEAAESDKKINIYLGLRAEQEGGDEFFLYLPELPDLSEFDNKVEEIHINRMSLTHLHGLPKGVTVVWCNDNQLTSLDGLPESVEEIHCRNNLLTNLKGLPYGIKTIDCGDNSQLISLEGLPPNVKNVDCYNTPGNFTKQDIENAKRGVYTNRIAENLDISKLIKRYLLTS